MVDDKKLTTRRAVLGTTALTLTSLAGCAGNDTSTDSTTTSTRQSATNRTSTTATTTTTQAETETTDQPTETAETTTEDKPGYKQYHWHGQLFFDIDGQLVNFDRSKYYLDNIEQERPETVYFHFHDSAHGPNEWSNEKKVITFERGLNLLPDISYSKRSGSHVVGYNGTTYNGSRSGIDVSISEGTDAIDPTKYEIEHADQFWVSLSTDSGSSGGDTRSGKIMFDVNNRRLDFTASKYQQAGTERFQFANSDPPYYGWTSQGDPITLSEVFDQLPDISYSNSGGHVIEYSSGGNHGGTYKASDDGTEISIRQRATAIDPSSYELQDGDIIWVYVHSSTAPDNEH
ncbi:hypothetical protein [Halorussus halophilus]|uniref:hypothetical protein n=1 Tax=Halorussus halophilus TaxID=2650975 RepID=UPI0013013364|nr:hypothetical protein [Halorussus halophilus]